MYEDGSPQNVAQTNHTGNISISSSTQWWAFRIACGYLLSYPAILPFKPLLYQTAWESSLFFKSSSFLRMLMLPYWTQNRGTSILRHQRYDMILPTPDPQIKFHSTACTCFHSRKNTFRFNARRVHEPILAPLVLGQDAYVVIADASHPSL